MLGRLLGSHAVPVMLTPEHKQVQPLLLREIGVADYLQLAEFDLTIPGERDAGRQLVGEQVHFLEQAYHRTLRHLRLRKIDHVVAQADVATIAQVLGQVPIDAMAQTMSEIKPFVFGVAMPVEYRLAPWRFAERAFNANTDSTHSLHDDDRCDDFHDTSPNAEKSRGVGARGRATHPRVELEK